MSQIQETSTEAGVTGSGAYIGGKNKWDGMDGDNQESRVIRFCYALPREVYCILGSEGGQEIFFVLAR